MNTLLREGPRPRVEGTGGLVELGARAAHERLEAAALGGREVVGELEGLEVLEHAPGLVEALLERERAWGRLEGGRLRPDRPQGRTQQRGSVCVVGDAVRLDEREGLALA
jgi:hypothetical protein